MTRPNSASPAGGAAREKLPAWPGPSRAFNLTVAQHNGFETCVYAISGRRQGGDGIELLKDVYEYSPVDQQWRKRSDAPQCVMAAAEATPGS